MKLFIPGTMLSIKDTLNKTDIISASNSLQLGKKYIEMYIYIYIQWIISISDMIARVKMLQRKSTGWNENIIWGPYLIWRIRNSLKNSHLKLILDESVEICQERKEKKISRQNNIWEDPVKGENMEHSTRINAIQPKDTKEKKK